ncbi:MAG TPA: Rid family detoxifying hydrolase [Sphingobacteriaceae bacterium]|nr:Rid family detoxifying hydrolase [Sphingobacteriaceae bacterium]
MKEIINTTFAPAPIGPYSQAVKTGNTLYVSGQIAIVPATNELLVGTIEEETELVMKHLENILETAGYQFSDVVKTSIFLSDMSLFPVVNEIYGQSFKVDPPARETVAVKGLPKNVNVEISLIAYKG